MTAKVPVKRTTLGPRPGIPAKLGSDRVQARNGFSDILRDLTADRNLAIGAIRAGFPASLLKEIGQADHIEAFYVRSPDGQIVHLGQ